MDVIPSTREGITEPTLARRKRRRRGEKKEKEESGECLQMRRKCRRLGL
jgi:hypothetical protein